MKAIEAKLGAKVTRANSSYHKGNISSNSVAGRDDQTVIVEWQNGDLEKCDVNELVFAPAILDQEWQAVQSELTIAAAALTKANNLLRNRKDSADLREWEKDGLITLDDIWNELDHAGWNTSSMTRDC